MCDICADEDLCYYCVDDHECESWKKEFVSRFIPATMNPARYKNVRDQLQFIEDLISKCKACEDKSSAMHTCKKYR